jgi:hypothetical protein
MARRWQHLAAGAMIGLALAAIACPVSAEQSCDPSALGCLIFNGQHAIPAHLRDDDRPLPDWTTRCVNCHTQTGAAAAYAPPLTAESLLVAERRRGGPPSNYDSVTFCRAVKDGIDPSEVLLRKAMPQYQISDAECTALWQYLTHR